MLALRLQRMGLDVEKMILCQPDNGEMALEVVDQLVRSSAVDIIAVDSVAALTPRAEIEGEIGAIQGVPALASLSVAAPVGDQGPCVWHRPAAEPCMPTQEQATCLMLL